MLLWFASVSTLNLVTCGGVEEDSDRWVNMYLTLTRMEILCAGQKVPTATVKKAEKKFGMRPTVLSNICRATTESVLTSSITVRYGNRTTQDRKALQRVIKNSHCISGVVFPSNVSWLMNALFWVVFTKNWYILFH